MSYGITTYQVHGASKEELFARLMFSVATGTTAHFNALNLDDANDTPEIADFEVDVRSFDKTLYASFQVTDSMGREFELSFKRSEELVRFTIVTPTNAP